MKEQLYKSFDLGVDKVRQESKDFCQALGVTTFGYVRVYHNGMVSWLTTKPDQDRFLIESGSLDNDPLFNTPEALKEGAYLWFNDRQFEGCEAFYRDRARLFQMDHGMVLVKHQKDYLETCCFSGLLDKRPLYNTFLNEKELFTGFMDHFAKKMNRRLLQILEQGVSIGHFKSEYGKSTEKELNREALIKACGYHSLLQLSKRERECLLLFRKGNTFQDVANHLGLSVRTVEHYMESIKNKLNVSTRSELFLIAEKLQQFF